MSTVSASTMVETTLASIRERTPAYGELADQFGRVFLAVAGVRDDLMKKGVAIPAIDPARISAGVPVLVGNDMTLWANELVESASVVVPILSEVLALDEATRKSLIEWMADPKHVSGLAQAWIEGDRKYFENTSVCPETVSPDVLLSISETISVPVLCAVVETLGESLASLSWDHGYCPVCGSTPSISMLSPKEVSELDQLVGGGGKKYLHCSHCGHDWRFKRNACPACGNDDAETREVFYADGTNAERIEACHACGKYCLNVDLREYEPRPNLDVLQMGLIHLDLFAHEHKLQPLTATLWNTLES
ncbi:formate dehydrogenase accessory protein FdhE [Pseudodesulfovibrio sp. JC047]|uniref:formate dehydrogenase accessory protein FdhE n=1 Tax=Pseudodesulfovibrio sp. JC047 TaxID=2683199 RepID=UPI0013D002B4|nr:formate dehydrogenase accessory protein FdhE [Pseudodesulfovibrio sp. JC047]NDV18572.1 formate dehydrogenase accessory protein FdhE [Pseudodesulfovibrio sp. JC047]